MRIVTSLIRIALFLVLLLFSHNFAYASKVNVITGFKSADHKNYSRFVLNTKHKAQFKIFALNNPSRVVIDITNVKWGDFSIPLKQTGRIKNVRKSFAESNADMRLVLDLNQPVAIEKYFQLKSDAKHSHRLVIDLKPTNVFLDNIAFPEIPKPIYKKPQNNHFPTPKLKRKVARKPIIVIDAGHGGHDPGAIGRRGSKEKDLTLKYAQELKRQLRSTGKYKVKMTRDSDRYIKLRERVNISRRSKGDLFISIHANSHKNRKTRGWSVYTLSEKASDKEAAALARKENKSGLINGVDLAYKGNEISALLIDMVQRDTKNLSASFAENLTNKTRKRAKLLRNPHRFAGFRVLTGADIPSVLIEIGYLTNRKEESLLRSENYKKKLAKAIVEAIDTHFIKYKTD